MRNVLLGLFLALFLMGCADTSQPTGTKQTDLAVDASELAVNPAIFNGTTNHSRREVWYNNVAMSPNATNDYRDFLNFWVEERSGDYCAITIHNTGAMFTEEFEIRALFLFENVQYGWESPSSDYKKAIIKPMEGATLLFDLKPYDYCESEFNQLNITRNGRSRIAWLKKE